MKSGTHDVLQAAVKLNVNMKLEPAAEEINFDAMIRTVRT